MDEENLNEESKVEDDYEPDPMDVAKAAIIDDRSFIH